MKIIDGNFYFNSFQELYSKYPRLKKTLESMKINKNLPFKCNFINDSCLAFVYKDFFDNDEMKKYEALKECDLVCIKNPDNFIHINNKVHGYTINTYECTNLYNLSYHYSIKSVIKNLDELDIDIVNLSNDKILLLYINPEHLVYNSFTRNIEFLNIQEFEIREDLEVEDIMKMNYILIHTVLLYAMFGRNISEKLENKKDVIYFFRKKILEEELDGEYSTKYLFDKVHATFEEVTKDEVNTIGEFRSLSKTLKIKE